MGLLIEASVLIEHERGRLDVASRIANRSEEEVFLSVVTASELLHGVHRAMDRNARAPPGRARACARARRGGLAAAARRGERVGREAWKFCSSSYRSGRNAVSSSL